MYAVCMYAFCICIKLRKVCMNACMYHERGLDTKLKESARVGRPILALNNPRTRIAMWLLETCHTKYIHSKFSQSTPILRARSHLGNLAPNLGAHQRLEDGHGHSHVYMDPRLIAYYPAAMVSIFELDIAERNRDGPQLICII